ncbi:MAG: cyclic nucleotide-binding domain-containing protein [Halobacteriales archaeon]|nr:cyclic nucleotide-binding domain-containing protein [Halobacteriales archaeon]
MIATTEQIADVRPFVGLDEEVLAAVAEKSLYIWVPKGQTVIRQGDSGFEFYIIRAGDAIVKKDGEIIARLGRGAVFGEMVVEGGGRRSADVIAETPLSLMTMSVWNYRSITEEYPELAERFREIAESRRNDT